MLIRSVSALSRRVVLLHTPVPPHAPQDDQDTLIQAEAIMGALTRMGYDTVKAEFTGDVERSMEHLAQLRPWLVFNLVETLEGCGRLIHIAPSFLDAAGIPYTGCPADALLVTTNKIGAKRFLASAGIPVAQSQSCRDAAMNGLRLMCPVILKSIWEHASAGLSDTSVYTDPHEMHDALSRMPMGQLDGWFLEEFIDGREFNYALLASDRGAVQALPPGEILFEDFPPEKPTIVGFKAKWEEGSFEYTHTPRTFDFSASDKPLLEKMREYAERCWTLFGLRGYARVDFRVARDGTPYVLEVNANPCIAPDSGFVAAGEQASIDYDEIIRRILMDTCRQKGLL